MDCALYRFKNAVVRCKAANENAGNAQCMEFLMKIGSLKGGVSFLSGGASFGNNMNSVRQQEPGVKSRTGCSSHTMRRPNPSLRKERSVIGRVPIPSSEDWQVQVLEKFDHMIERSDDATAFEDRKTAAGNKIPLHVDDDESVARGRSQLGAESPEFFLGEMLSFKLKFFFFILAFQFIHLPGLIDHFFQLERIARCVSWRCSVVM